MRACIKIVTRLSGATAVLETQPALTWHGCNTQGNMIKKAVWLGHTLCQLVAGYCYCLLLPADGCCCFASGHFFGKKGAAEENANQSEAPTMPPATTFFTSGNASIHLATAQQAKAFLVRSWCTVHTKTMKATTTETKQHGISGSTRFNSQDSMACLLMPGVGQEH